MSDNGMQDVTIGAPGFDVQAIVAGIRERVREKHDRGDYNDPRILRAERTNLANLKSREDFVEFYMDCLREAIFVDINDFEIIERRARFGRLLVALKRTIWKLLKFYTYRLWSQQNQVNGLLLSAVESVGAKYREDMARLQQRIRELEDRLARLEKP